MKNDVLVLLTFLLALLVSVKPSQQVYGRTPNAPTAPGQVQFQQANISIAESGGTVDLVVERTGGSDGEILASAATFDGTATAGEDYQATAETLTFADGETEKTVSIPIFDNNTAEPDETFLVSLSILSGPGTVGDPSTATVTILNDDTTPPGILQFSAAQYAVLENAVTATFTVQRTGGTSDEVQVSYATMDDTAVSGFDYMSAVGTLTFPDGAAEQTFTVTLLDDPGAEGSETFTIKLNNVVGVATLGEPSTTTVTILDNETASFIYLPLIQR